MPEALLRIRLTPRGAKNEILGWDGNTLRVKVTAPPVEGAANRVCVDFVARQLGVRSGQVSIASGEKSREKTLRILGLSQDDLRERLAAG